MLERTNADKQVAIEFTVMGWYLSKEYHRYEKKKENGPKKLDEPVKVKRRLQK